MYVIAASLNQQCLKSEKLIFDTIRYMGEHIYAFKTPKGVVVSRREYQFGKDVPGMYIHNDFPLVSAREIKRLYVEDPYVFPVIKK